MFSLAPVARLQLFREPIRELYLELFPQDRADEASDSTVQIHVLVRLEYEVALYLTAVLVVVDTQWATNTLRSMS